MKNWEPRFASFAAGNSENKFAVRSLFQSGYHILHSGQESWWKIDCDALSSEDIETLAMLIADLVTPFGSVEGVPRGGLRLAACLAQYQDVGPLLIVDDVWTTGASMEEWRAGREAIGAVVFAREFGLRLFFSTGRHDILKERAARTGPP